MDRIVAKGYTNLFKQQSDKLSSIEYLGVSESYPSGIIRFLLPYLSPRQRESLFIGSLIRGYLDIAKLTVVLIESENIEEVIEGGHTESVQLILPFVDPEDLDLNATLILAAAKLPTSRILRLLQDRLADNFREIIENKIREGYLEYVFKQGQLANIRILVENGFHPDIVLLLSIKLGHTRVVKYLLDRRVIDDEAVDTALNNQQPGSIQLLFDRNFQFPENPLEMVLKTSINDVPKRTLESAKLIVQLFSPTEDQIRKALQRVTMGDPVEIFQLFSVNIRSDDIHLINQLNPDSPRSVRFLTQLGVRGDITPAIVKSLYSPNQLTVLLESKLPFQTIGLLKRITKIKLSSYFVTLSSALEQDRESSIISLFQSFGIQFPENEIRELFPQLTQLIRVKEVLRKQLYKDDYSPETDILLLTPDPGLQYLLRNTMELVHRTSLDRLTPVLLLDGNETRPLIIARALDAVVFWASTSNWNDQNIYGICRVLSSINWLTQAIIPPFPYRFQITSPRFYIIGRHRLDNSFTQAYSDYLSAVPDSLRQTIEIRILDHFQFLPGEETLTFFDLYNFLITLR